MIKINNLDYSVGKKEILKNITFSIPKQSVVAIIGSNGAGKTTLIEVICGLRKAPEEVLEISKDEKLVYIHDELLVFSYLYVSEFIEMIAKLNRLTKIEKDKIIASFAKLNIKKLFATQIKNLSLGERQKILLLVGFLSRASYLFFDEPFNGLDASSYQLVIELLQQKKHLGSIFFSTHELTNLYDICDKIIFLKDGQIKREINKEDGSFVDVQEIYSLF